MLETGWAGGVRLETDLSGPAKIPFFVRPKPVNRLMSMAVDDQLVLTLPVPHTTWTPWKCMSRDLRRRSASIFMEVAGSAWTGLPSPPLNPTHWPVHSNGRAGRSMPLPAALRGQLLVTVRLREAMPCAWNSPPPRRRRNFEWTSRVPPSFAGGKGVSARPAPAV